MSSPPLPSAIGPLVDFGRGLTLEQLPERVVEHGRLALLDFLSLTVSGSKQPATEIVLDLARSMGGTAQATIPAIGDRTSLVNVARVAGVAGHVDDFDDTHEPTILHPTSPILAAALPVAEWLESSGRSLIEAYVVGVETACRVALALASEHYARGWHVTGTAGVVGAAAAVGRLLELTENAYTMALGAAATMAAGHREQFGWMTKSLHAGAAAANGLWCALAAQRGFTSAPTSIDGIRGMLQVMSTASRPTALTADLGSSWELDRVGFKPYSCGVVTHPAIDAMIRLRAASVGSTADIEHIVLRVHPLVRELTGKVLPATALEGKFSVGFVAALGLLKGVVIPELFTDGMATDSEVIALQRRIEVVVDPSLGQHQAGLEATLRGGREVRIEVPAALGSVERPMTRQDVEAKASSVLGPALGPENAQLLIGVTRAPERLATVRDLVERTIVGRREDRRAGE